MPVIGMDDFAPAGRGAYDGATSVGRFTATSIVCGLLLTTAVAAGAQRGAVPRNLATPENLQVLTPDVNLPALMQSFNAALGVQCTHCHVQDNFASDDNPKKAVARTMLRMQRRVAARFPDSGNDFENARYLPFPEGKQYVTCATCHQGSVTPVSAAPNPEGPPRAPEPGAPAGPPGGARGAGAARAGAPGGRGAQLPPLAPGRGRQQHMNMVELPSDTDTFMVMPGFRAALGVECNFCHVFGTGHERGHADERQLDGNPKKLVARNMIGMLKEINAALFPDGQVDIVFAASSIVPESGTTVSCYTCHRGSHLPLAGPVESR